MAKIELVKRVKYAGDIHEKLVELGWDLDTAALFCDDLPDAGVAPVRHGKWLDVQETDLYVPDHKFTITKTVETCSECKARIGFVGAKLYLFDGICPNCGARMDGGADNG